METSKILAIFVAMIAPVALIAVSRANLPPPAQLIITRAHDANNAAFNAYLSKVELIRHQEGYALRAAAATARTQGRLGEADAIMAAWKMIKSGKSLSEETKWAKIISSVKIESLVGMEARKKAEKITKVEREIQTDPQ